MNGGFLSQYFAGVAVKRLSAVEADATKSHQHEYNGITAMKAFMGEPAYGVKNTFPARFIWFGGENEGITEEAFATWYQSRKLPRSEYRLYFPTTPVSELADIGDLLVVARQTDGNMLIIIARAGSTVENQLLWLFGFSYIVGQTFETQQIEGTRDLQVDYVVRYILEELGIEPEEPDTPQLDQHLEQFGGAFPSTAVFSALARAIVNIAPQDDPDAALVNLMDTEERLFLRLERHIVAKRLDQGFMTADGADVESFFQFSLSVQNRRKSRVGHALENHLAWIFDSIGLRYQRGAETENRKKPDFLFPGKTEYDLPSFPATSLSMLGVKSTCKDRWRQVLAEANRIQRKHLLTLEPGISTNQTNEMKASELQLVLPASLHRTYTPEQQGWLFSVRDFVAMIKEKERR
ncbi:MAG: restriction endonuclease [Nitrospirae bacterium]|nr:restriction endonuclease [Nitrospirota bacterium]